VLLLNECLLLLLLISLSIQSRNFWIHELTDTDTFQRLILSLFDDAFKCICYKTPNDGNIPNDKLKMIWKEVVRPYLWTLSHTLTEIGGDNYENIRQRFEHGTSAIKSSSTNLHTMNVSFTIVHRCSLLLICTVYTTKYI